MCCSGYIYAYVYTTFCRWDTATRVYELVYLFQWYAEWWFDTILIKIHGFYFTSVHRQTNDFDSLWAGRFAKYVIPST